MNYSIVFSSRTGNTKKLAATLKKCISQEECLYFGEHNEQALNANIIFVGFWTDKGECDEVTKAFLKTLKNSRIFLFGTAGFGRNAAYFEKILDSVKENIDTTVSVIGNFMCQGKMPASVLERYEKMLSDGAEVGKIQGMIDNFHNAESHPNQTDLMSLKNKVNEIVKTYI